MITRLLLIFTLLFPLSLFSCNIDIRDIKWVSANDLAQSLKGRPRMAVGFDVDDTVLFSSPVFQHIAYERCKNDLNTCTKDKDFWNEANTSDSYSLEKKVGMALVKMHLARGDKVYFITARPPSEHETLSELLRIYLNAPNLPNVIFTGLTPGKNLKVKPIMQLKLAMYYGDADTDITAAMDARIRPIRILRAKNSIDTHPSCPGLYNEEVIVGSDL